MAALKKIGRLFVIKTRLEAWMVTYAIAVGAVERGHHYVLQFPGFGGWLLALACTGVVFIAGAKLLDSVPKRGEAAALPAFATGIRPRARRERFGSASPLSLRTGSRPTKRPAGRREAWPADRTRHPDC